MQLTTQLLSGPPHLQTVPNQPVVLTADAMSQRYSSVSSGFHQSHHHLRVY